jgi:hypothetical protein
MAKAHKVLGTTTDVTDCELCGRTDLKGTIALLPLDADGNAEGETVYFGSDCGSKAAGWTQREIRRQARSADDAKRREEQASRNAEQKAAHAAWSSWLTAQTGEAEIIDAIQKLGGFALARTLYRQEVAA